MRKKILFICDPLEQFKITTDTTYGLILAANDLQYQVFYSLPQDIYLNNNQVYCNCKKLELLSSSTDKPNPKIKWYNEDKYETTHVDTFYAIFVRNDPPFNMEYYYLTQTLHFVTKSKVVNNSIALRNFNEKLAILNFPNLIPNTLVTKNRLTIDNFINLNIDCVIKPLDLMAGRGIFKISQNDTNYGAIIETSTQFYTQTVMVQKFIPEVVNGDKRVFIVNGQIIKHCLYRIPQNNEIRGNIAAGGRGEVHPITKNDYKIATEIAKWLQLNNILFAGIDIIGNYITEINITSPTGTRQILQKTGINIPQLLIESV